MQIGCYCSFVGLVLEERFVDFWFFLPSSFIYMNLLLFACTRDSYKGCASLKQGSAASIKFALCQFMKLFLPATSVYFVYRLPGAVSRKNESFLKGKEAKS